jgi:acetyl-CoA synthetase
MLLSVQDIEQCFVNFSQSRENILEIHRAVSEVSERYKDDECALWNAFTNILKPSHPHELHKLLYDFAYRSRDSDDLTPRFAYLPRKDVVFSSNAFRACELLDLVKPNEVEAVRHCSDYKSLVSFAAKVWSDLYSYSVSNKEDFFKFVVDSILNVKFTSYPDSMISKVNLKGDKDESDKENSEGDVNFAYLENGELNIVDSCFAFKSQKTALVFQRNENSKLEHWSEQHLFELVNRVASSLVNLRSEDGLSLLSRGDRIAICMPMTAETVAIYLGIVKAGFTVVSIADSFSAEEIAVRIQISQTKVIFTQDYIFRDGKKISLASRIFNAEQNLKDIRVLNIILGGGLDVDTIDSDLDTINFKALSWLKFLRDSASLFDSVICKSSDFTNILFSSGTTSAPKAIPWTHSSPIRAGLDGYFQQNIKENDVVCWPTNIGWMMGPWLIYATLLNRGVIALFHGSPVGSSFAKFVELAQVNILGLVPSIVKALRTKSYAKDVDWSSIRLFSSTGEASNPDEYLWLMSRIEGYSAPIIEYCGGTEISGSYLSCSVLQPQSPSMFSTLCLAQNIELLDEYGFPKKCDFSKSVSSISGEVAIIPPSIGLSTALLNNDHFKVYYKGMPKGYRRHGDEMQKVSFKLFDDVYHHYYRAHGRVDDTMKLGGIKISSVELEKVCNRVSGVVETAAIAYNPPSGGPSILVIFAVLHEDQLPNKTDLQKSFQNEIKKHLNPLFHVSDVIVVPNLPRTASNKVMRRTLRDQYASLVSSR